MELEAFFWAALITGLLALVVTMLMPAEPGDDALVGIPLMALVSLGVAAFGAGGMFSDLVLDRGASAVVTAVAAAVLVPASGTWWFRAIHRNAERESFERIKLVGHEAVVSEGIEPGRVGRVAVQYAGMTRSLEATGDEGIERGAKVVIDDAVGGRLKVSRLSPPSDPEGG